MEVTGCAVASGTRITSNRRQLWTDGSSARMTKYFIPALVMLSVPALAAEPAYVGIWASHAQACSDISDVFQITAKEMRGKEWMCDVKEVSPDGTGWMARLSCGSEGYAYTLTSSWQIAPEGRLRETVKTCQPSRNEDAEACRGAAGRSNVYVRCKAGTRSPWFRN